MLREQGCDVLAERAVSDRPDRHVDAQHHVDAGGVAGAEVPDGLAQNPAVDLLDQPEALGVVEERPGRDQVAVVIGKAQQQLEGLGPVRA
ncbi:MAG: hypothetical protein H0U07_09780 [Actinobacteria bacterium]|nr:hypothetical protein [Actinomycetota bacterium]